jgi:hypothetical protein
MQLGNKGDHLSGRREMEISLEWAISLRFKDERMWRLRRRALAQLILDERKKTYMRPYTCRRIGRIED